MINIIFDLNDEFSDYSVCDLQDLDINSIYYLINKYDNAPCQMWFYFQHATIALLQEPIKMELNHHQHHILLDVDGTVR